MNGGKATNTVADLNMSSIETNQELLAKLEGSS
jgi:hypothetical protein